MNNLKSDSYHLSDFQVLEYAKRLGCITKLLALSAKYRHTDNPFARQATEAMIYGEMEEIADMLDNLKGIDILAVKCT